MADKTALVRRLDQINGKGYKAYQILKGRYRFDGFELFIDHVQTDPYATPSRMRVRVDRSATGFGPDLTSSKSRNIALCDFLTRSFSDHCRDKATRERGTGKSGLITIDRPGQEVLEQSAMVVTPEYIEARFFMGLPAADRRIASKDAAVMFIRLLPDIVAGSLFMDSADSGRVCRHIEAAEDADFLRSRLDALGLVAFVANGSLLPRASGIDDAPLKHGAIVPFTSPRAFEVRVDLPNQKGIVGLGIPKGVTLIVGGGFHGKSTLLKALAAGVYNHVPGDGREGVVTGAGAVKIRAAEGRNIEKTDISAFINHLPLGKSTTTFSTANASGSTSQAAAISEALEAGASALLLDEDTCATNFMVRDMLMQRLVAKENEPITPFIDRVEALYRERGVSTVLVTGGSGDYFGVADHVIQMRDFTCLDVTARARAIFERHRSKRKNEARGKLPEPGVRVPLNTSINPRTAAGRKRIKSRGQRAILLGEDLVDLGDLEQIVHPSQTRALAWALVHAGRYMDAKTSLKQVITAVDEALEHQGLDMLMPFVAGDLARFRPLELAAAINRMRTLSIKHELFERLT